MGRAKNCNEKCVNHDKCVKDGVIDMFCHGMTTCADYTTKEETSKPTNTGRN